MQDKVLVCTQLNDKARQCLVIYIITHMYNVRILLFILFTAAADPHPVVTEVSFILSTKPRDTDPPELILSFSVMVAPPTYVTCQVDGTPVDVVDLFREVTAGEYQPPNTASPVTNVTVSLRTRQAGDYMCTVSVYRASMIASTDPLTSPETSHITISGRISMAQSVNVRGIKHTIFCF